MLAEGGGRAGHKNKGNLCENNQLDGINSINPADAGCLLD